MADLEEAQLLLNKEETISQEAQYGKKFIALAGVVTIGVLGTVGFHKASSTNTELAHEFDNMKGIVAKGSDWDMYKVTISVIPGSASGLNTFWTDYIAPEVVDLPTDLGCASTRNAISLYNQQMHFVDGKAMEREGPATTYWYDYFVELNGDLTTFNSFQHNKVVMFVPQVQRHVYAMEKDNINTMKRLSVDSNGESIAHLDFSIEGRMYELVGPAKDIDDATLSKFVSWKEEECPEAHALEQTLVSYTEKYYDLKENYNSNDDEVSNFAFDVPMVIKVSISTDDFEKQNDMAHLKKFSGAHISDVSTYDMCEIVQVSWDYKNEGADVFKLPPVSYVKSYLDSPGAHSVTDYLDYLWDDQHVKFAGDYKENWGDNWDHWLDCHIGMQVTIASTKDTQWAYHNMIYEELHTASWPVGYRHGEQSGVTGNDFHFYTGYRNTYAWEWLINEGRTKEHEFNLCACIPENNAKIYLTEMIALYGEKKGLAMEESQCNWYEGQGS